jgi:AAA domain
MKERPDINDTLRSEGPEAVRGRHDRAQKYPGNGQGKSSDKRQRFRLIPFRELTPNTSSAYLVQGIVPRDGITAGYGPPKCGKSLWAFDVAMHSALGWNYRGRRVISGPVIYCAFEGADGFKARAAAFRQHHGIKPDTEVPFYLIPLRLDLVKEHRALIASIREQMRRENPVSVTLDTLNRSLAGSESSDQDMTAYLNAADAIRRAFGCAVIIVHHCGIDGSRPRGHTSLTGAVDAQLAVKRDDAGNTIVTVECMKDGPEGYVIASALQVVTVGADDDGEPITSCVIVPVDTAAIRIAPRKLSDRQRLALRALADCSNDRGRAPPADFGLPAGLLAVQVSEWREEMFRCGALNKEAKNPRSDFQRVKLSLQARGLIGERDNLVWGVSNG